MRRLPFRPLIEPGGIDNDLPIGSQFDLGAVHRTRSRAFEVDAFAVIAAAVAWTLEFVLARFPVRSAAEVGTARVDHEHSVGSAIDPDAVFLLKFCVDAQRELRGVANLENRVGFEKSARKKESEKSQEPCSQERGYCDPHQTAPAAVDLGIRRSGRGQSTSRCRFRGSHRWRADVFRGIHRARGRRLGWFGIRGGLRALRFRHVSSSLFFSTHRTKSSRAVTLSSKFWLFPSRPPSARADRRYRLLRPERP